LGLAVNLLASALLALTICFYVFIYTMGLKRRTPQNIVIGGAAGAFPPMISWAAVTGSLDVMPILMFLIIFLWTPPHFWALALYKSGDYGKAGIPMMPNVKGDVSTKWQMLFYTFLLIPVTLAPGFIDGFRTFYVAAALVLNIIFVSYNVRLIRDKQNKIAPKMFFYSIFYLFALFMLLIIDRMELGNVVGP
jgi:protoheme IX farnesyltransferase